VEANKFS